MNKAKKDRYLVAVAGVFIGLVAILTGWNAGISTLVGKAVTIFGVIIELTGIVSFFNQNVADIFLHWIKLMEKNQSRVEINQYQHKPNNSPQAGTIHGGVTYNYNSVNQPEETKKKVDEDKIRKRLKDIKSELNDLKKVSFREGSSNKSALKKELKGIIHRIYPNDAIGNEKRLITTLFAIYHAGSGDDEFQKNYLEDVEGLLITIDIILREMDLE